MTIKSNQPKENLTPEDLADTIMRWDWRDMFRYGHKKTIIEMFEAYREQEVEKIKNTYNYDNKTQPTERNSS